VEHGRLEGAVPIHGDGDGKGGGGLINGRVSVFSNLFLDDFCVFLFCFYLLFLAPPASTSLEFRYPLLLFGFIPRFIVGFGHKSMRFTAHFIGDFLCIGA
jgi:hypothetical protein